MPRPSRPQWVTRVYARRRHRTWMTAMTLATLGWGCFWLQLFLEWIAPALAPERGFAAILICIFGALGLVAALLTLRARKAWLLFAAVALFANASLLLLPWIALFDRPVP